MALRIRIERHGGPEVLEVEESTLPPLGPHEVRVRHEAIGLNFRDIYLRRGVHPLRLPSGLGLEAAGTIEATGTAVEALAVGDRVAYGFGPLGAYATERVLEADDLVLLPRGMDAETAAAVMLKGMTVEYLVERAFRVLEGQWVLFHSVAGGVGLLACQWLKTIGARVIGTVRSQEKAEIARRSGCDEVIVRSSEDFVARTLHITGGSGVPIAYDSIGRDTLTDSLRCLAPRGTLVSFGASSGPPPPLEMSALLRQGSVYVTRPGLTDYVPTVGERRASSVRVLDMVGRGHLRVEIGHRWPLFGVSDAHRRMESGDTHGASILIP